MQADGHIHPKELARLAAICKKRDIPAHEIEEALKHPEKVTFELPESIEARSGLLYDLVYMMMIDGHVDAKEMAIAEKAADALGFDRAAVPSLMKQIVLRRRNGTSELPSVEENFDHRDKDD